MSNERPLFQLTGIGMAVKFSKDDGSSIGILTLTTNSGHINFGAPQTRSGTHLARSLRESLCCRARPALISLRFLRLPADARDMHVEGKQMWKKIEIKACARTAELWKTIRDSFEAIFVANGAPEDAAMYFRSQIPGDDVTLYLSPGTVRIFDGAKRGAQPCAKPSTGGLLVRHASATLSKA
jgi:hypothetical protein